MARPLRIEYAGAYYHVMNRGNRRQTVFAEPKDYELCLGTETFRERVRRAYVLTRTADRPEQPAFARARRSIPFDAVAGAVGEVCGVKPKGTGGHTYPFHILVLDGPLGRR